MKKKVKKLSKSDKSLQQLIRPTSLEELFSKIRKIYEEGRHLQGKALKNYSGGALIEIAQNIISFSEDKIVMKNDEYFSFCGEDSRDKERLDISVRVNDKIKILVECRAWLDKPFLLLKIMAILRLLYGKCVPDDTLFIVICYSADYNKFILKSCLKMAEAFLNHPIRVEIISLTNKKRPSDKQPNENWFTNGFEEEKILQIISLIKKGIL